MTVIATLDAQAVVHPATADKRRTFMIPYVYLNYNDANVRVRDPLSPISGRVRRDAHTRITKVTVKTTGSEARFIRASLSYQRTKLAQAPDIQPTPIWHFQATDSDVFDFDAACSPHDDNDLVLTIGGYTATDDIWIFIEGWFDE